MRILRLRRLGFALALSATAGLFSSLAAEADAEACGACFTPSENNSVVTDHRMILTIGAEQSTLYDQIKYQGNPQSFAWVLPIRGTATIGISADSVFAALDSQTSVQVNRPPTNCPQQPSSCRSAFGGSPSSAVDNGENGVNVLKQETVGPYETVQLRSTDPQALNKWLAERGFVVPAAIQPVISAYVAEQFDFLALKLVPGSSVQAMRPVRVTTPGASPVLPLRMIAAGAGASVGVTLWVIGDGRWEPQNFPKFTVTEKELVWDWASSSSNFKQIRAQLAGATGAGAFEQETSLKATTYQLESTVASTAGIYNAAVNPTAYVDPSADYQDQKDASGVVTKRAADVFREDMFALFGFEHRVLQYNSTRQVQITRMRADIPQASLANDLVLQASADQSELARQRNVIKQQGEPNCPIYDGCSSAGSAPRSEAYARSTTSTCAVSPGAGIAPVGVGALCMALGLGLVVARRRRSSNRA